MSQQMIKKMVTRRRSHLLSLMKFPNKKKVPPRKLTRIKTRQVILILSTQLIQKLKILLNPKSKILSKKTHKKRSLTSLTFKTKKS